MGPLGFLLWRCGVEEVSVGFLGLSWGCQKLVFLIGWVREVIVGCGFDEMLLQTGVCRRCKICSWKIFGVAVRISMKFYRDNTVVLENILRLCRTISFILKKTRA